MGEAALPPVDRPSEYVDTRIGSGGFAYAHGSAFPGAARPHGMVKVGPDTTGPLGALNFLHYSGYWYEDEAVTGFSHMHLHGTGATDYGVVALMPALGFSAPATTSDGYRLPWRKSSEVAAPGAYAITLESSAGPIAVELTAHSHSAFHRYRFPAGLFTPTLILDLDHHLIGGEVRDADLVLDRARGEARGRLRSLGGMSRGYGGYDVFFVLRARAPWRTQQSFAAGQAPADRAMISGKGVGAALTFTPAQGETTVEVQVGLSLVSLDAAAQNLAAELGAGDAGAYDFAGAQAAARAAWDERLLAARVHGGSARERRIFYAALYRALLMPTQHSDVSGDYRGHDGQIHRLRGRYLSDLSLWDSYRTLHPLYTLLWPATQEEVLASLFAMQREGGFFPRWPLAGGDSGTMIGQAADILFAEGYLKGLRSDDDQARYEALRAAALDDKAPARGRGGRDGGEAYQRLGYAPASQGSAVSLTLEWAHDDLALAELAAALQHGTDAAALRERATGYRKLYDPATGFLRGRDEKGVLAQDGVFDPTCQCRDYREANAWQSLVAQHDVAGTAALLGGPEALVGVLSELFQRGKTEEAERRAAGRLGDSSPRPYYWHGNEPDIHLPFAFAQLGRPDLTRAWAAWVRDTYYTDGPDGLAGNDDGGTLSSWYVFAALGFYPIPGTDRYVLSAPLFPRVELRRPDGVFVIERSGVEQPGAPVTITLDGAPIRGAELRHGELRGGRTLRFAW